MAERVVALDLGCSPEAAISGEMLFQNDRRTFLLFDAMKLDHATNLHVDVGKAIVEFEQCSITKFGYPNDEAWSAIPRTRGLSYDAYEVLGGDWEAELVRLSRYGFPATQPRGRRHFLFLFHESSFECLARGYAVTISTDPIEQILGEISRKLLKD